MTTALGQLITIGFVGSMASILLVGFLWDIQQKRAAYQAHLDRQERKEEQERQERLERHRLEHQDRLERADRQERLALMVMSGLYLQGASRPDPIPMLTDQQQPNPWVQLPGGQR